MDIKIYVQCGAWAMDAGAFLDQLIAKGNDLMATMTELSNAVSQLKTKVDAFGPAVDALEQKIADALAGENLSQATKDAIDSAFADVQTMLGTAQSALDDAATQDASDNPTP